MRLGVVSIRCQRLLAMGSVVANQGYGPALPVIGVVDQSKREVFDVPGGLSKENIKTGQPDPREPGASGRTGSGHLPL